MEGSRILPIAFGLQCWKEPTLPNSENEPITQIYGGGSDTMFISSFMISKSTTLANL
jgi:hypothetical protein